MIALANGFSQLDSICTRRAHRRGDARHPLTLTEARACVKNSRVGCCAIANAQPGANSNKNLAHALFGCTRMPVRIGKVSPAIPLAAALAVLLSAVVAGFIDARNCLTKLFLGFCCCCVHGILHATREAAGKGTQRTRSTTPTLFTPLHAIYTRPSEVAAMLRTVPPPEGINARANCSVLGSNWMMVFGFTPDSLYQTIPSGVIAIPYGAAFAPPGEGHIFTAPELNSSLPRWPPLKSVK